jgi:hypothetical protein
MQMLIGNLTEVSLISGLTTTRGIEMLIGKSAEVSRVWGLTTTHGIEMLPFKRMGDISTVSKFPPCKICVQDSWTNSPQVDNHALGPDHANTTDAATLHGGNMETVPSNLEKPT